MKAININDKSEPEIVKAKGIVIWNIKRAEEGNI